MEFIGGLLHALNKNASVLAMHSDRSYSIDWFKFFLSSDHSKEKKVSVWPSLAFNT